MQLSTLARLNNPADNLLSTTNVRKEATSLRQTRNRQLHVVDADYVFQLFPTTFLYANHIFTCTLILLY